MFQNFLHLRIIKAICIQPLPELCLDTILSSDVHCQLWDRIHRIDIAFPNHVQSIEFATGGLQSRSRKVSREMGGPWAQFKAAQKRVWILNVIFQFFFFKKFVNISKILFSLCHYGVSSVEWWKMNLNDFSIRLRRIKMWRVVPACTICLPSGPLEWERTAWS